MLLSIINRMISLLNRAANRKSGFSLVFREMAADLTPRYAPSVAAETVPDYRTFTHTFAPRFIPERMISGGCSSKL